MPQRVQESLNPSFDGFSVIVMESTRVWWSTIVEGKWGRHLLATQRSWLWWKTFVFDMHTAYGLHTGYVLHLEASWTPFLHACISSISVYYTGPKLPRSSEVLEAAKVETNMLKHLVCFGFRSNPGVQGSCRTNKIMIMEGGRMLMNVHDCFARSQEGSRWSQGSCSSKIYTTLWHQGQ